MKIQYHPWDNMYLNSIENNETGVLIVDAQGLPTIGTSHQVMELYGDYDGLTQMLITDYFQPAVQPIAQQVHADAPPPEIVEEVESAEKEGGMEPPSPDIQDSLDNSLFEGGVEPVILRKILKPEIAPPTYAEVAATMTADSEDELPDLPSISDDESSVTSADVEKLLQDIVRGKNEVTDQDWQEAIGASISGTSDNMEVKDCSQQRIDVLVDIACKLDNADPLMYFLMKQIDLENEKLNETLMK